MRSENYSFFDEYAGPGDNAVCGNKTRTNSSFREQHYQSYSHNICNHLFSLVENYRRVNQLPFLFVHDVYGRYCADNPSLFKNADEQRTNRFNLKLHTAGIIAASFGLANLFSRPGGGSTYKVHSWSRLCCFYLVALTSASHQFQASFFQYQLGNGILSGFNCAGRWPSKRLALVFYLFLSVARRNLNDPENAIIGAFAGALTGSIITPLDVIKTRLLVQGSANQYNRIVDCVQTIIKEEGPSALLKHMNDLWS
ncbi:hypothetical protein HN873_001580 [Arachis hypogaea]